MVIWYWYSGCRGKSNPPDSKVHGANMGPTWGWQDPGGPNVGPMNLVIRAKLACSCTHPGLLCCHDRAPPAMHPLKMFEILGLHLKQLHGHKILMNATNTPEGLYLNIFSSTLSYHSCVSVQDIQQKGLLNKISLYAFTHPNGHHHVAKAMLFMVCMRDGCATFWSPMTSSEVTRIMWSPLWHSIHLPNSEIFIAQNNEFFIATRHIVQDAADATDWGTRISMGTLFAFLIPLE